ncbi:MAG: hypothetical protein WBB19_00880 [Desulforhopalus sp.]
MKKITVHAGLHKTGTSSVQLFFRDNHIRYFQDGFFYPSFTSNHRNGVMFNHSMPLFNIFCDDPEKYHMNKRYGITSSDLLLEVSNYKAQLINHLNDKRCNRVLFSGEDLSALSEGALRRLKLFFEENLGKQDILMECVIYVRHPLTWLTSEVQQSIKGGWSFSEAIAQKNRPAQPFYLNRLKNLKKVFGNNLVINKFEDAIRHSSGLVGHFLQHLDIPLLEDCKSEGYTQNASISMEAAEIISHVNSLEPFFQNGRVSSHRKQGDIWPLFTVRGTRFGLSRQANEEFWSDSRSGRQVLLNDFGIDYKYIDTTDPELLWNDESVGDLKASLDKLNPTVRALAESYIDAHCLK